MSRRMYFHVETTVADNADPEAITEKLFDLLASDPDDAVPEIETVEGVMWGDPE